MLVIAHQYRSSQHHGGCIQLTYKNLKIKITSSYFNSVSESLDQLLWMSLHASYCNLHWVPLHDGSPSSLTIAVRDVRRMKEFLADHLNLPRHVFWFCGSRVGSLITVWQFSGSYSKELQRFLDNTSALQSLNPPVSSVCLQSGPDTIASVEVCSVEKPPSPDTMDSEISSTTVTPSCSGKGTNYRLS